MPLASMTGFAKVAGQSGAWHLGFELKSVNAKGLDIRLRFAPPFDAIECEARARIAQKCGRGTIQVAFAAQRQKTTAEVHIDQALLREIIAAVANIPLPAMITPATLDALLAVPGVVEVRDCADDEAETSRVCRCVLELLDEALQSLVLARQTEGAALEKGLAQRLIKIAALTRAADKSPGRTPEAIKARLKQTLDLLAENTNFDQNRLHQEAVLLAAKADIREELDRLAAHTVAADELLARGGSVGRRLDFLAQELSREANTLCAKSNDASLTATALELRVEIERFREQVQNIE